MTVTIQRILAIAILSVCSGGSVKNGAS